MAEDLLVLSARLNAAPPAYLAPADSRVLELDGLLALNAELMEGERPLMLAVMEPLLSASAAEAPLPLAPALVLAVVVRVLEEDRLRPLRLATMPEPEPVEAVDGLLRRCDASSRRGSSPILPW